MFYSLETTQKQIKTSFSYEVKLQNNNVLENIANGVVDNHKVADTILNWVLENCKLDNNHKYFINKKIAQRPEVSVFSFDQQSISVIEITFSYTLDIEDYVWLAQQGKNILQIKLDLINDLLFELDAEVELNANCKICYDQHWVIDIGDIGTKCSCSPDYTNSVIYMIDHPIYKRKQNAL